MSLLPAAVRGASSERSLSLRRQAGKALGCGVAIGFRPPIDALNAGHRAVLGDYYEGTSPLGRCGSVARSNGPVPLVKKIDCAMMALAGLEDVAAPHTSYW